MSATVGNLTARHAWGWLVAANLVGVWLAALLVWPALGDTLEPFTYGRWMPLHLNGQLYGWCALPLVGALLAWCVDARHPQATRHMRVALGAWSLALAAGGVAWWGVVGRGDQRQIVSRLVRVGARAVVRRDGGAVDGVRGPRLVAARAARRAGQRQVARRSVAGAVVRAGVAVLGGGATGASLLGSTLGILTLYGLLPRLLGVGQCHLLGDTLGSATQGWWGWAVAGAWAVFAVIDRGNASHHALGQILGLGLLPVWVPLAWLYVRRFAWAAARPWLGGAFVWWLLLVVTGFWTFLPGLSERLNFTNALVGHAHLAMAGFVTSMNCAILRQLAPRTEPRSNVVAWQAACAVIVVALVALGLSE